MSTTPTISDEVLRHFALTAKHSTNRWMAAAIYQALEAAFGSDTADRALKMENAND